MLTTPVWRVQYNALPPFGLVEPTTTRPSGLIPWASNPLSVVTVAWPNAKPASAVTESVARGTWCMRSLLRVVARRSTRRVLPAREALGCVGGVLYIVGLQALTRNMLESVRECLSHSSHQRYRNSPREEGQEGNCDHGWAVAMVLIWIGVPTRVARAWLSLLRGCMSAAL